MVCRLFPDDGYHVQLLCHKYYPGRWRLRSSEHDGPSGDSVFTDNSHNFGQTIAIHKETALRQITVFNWSGIQYVMEMFCNGSGNHTYLQLTHNYISAGKSYNGHPLYKTSIPGFYFTIEMTFLQPAENMTSSTFWFDKTSTPITSEFTEFPSACSRTNVYSNLGKLMYGLKIYAYVDSDFAPTEAQLQSFTLSKNGDSDFYIDNPGSGLSNYKMKFNLAATGLKAVWPTCSASTISGTNVSGSTVKLGSFYPKQIMEGCRRPSSRSISPPASTSIILKLNWPVIMSGRKTPRY